MTEVFVVAPACSESGGPELCHQLVHTLNTARRVQPWSSRAAIVYSPFELAHKIPASYRRYDVAVARREDIKPGSTIVLPETYGHLVDKFPDCRLMYWWMSVNNFHKAAAGAAGAQIEALRRHPNIVHLYQSEYARGFLGSAHLGPAYRLGDRLADDYLKAITTPPTSVRRDLVAFNPVKGRPRTDLIFRALAKGIRPAPKVVPLEGFTREKMRNVLSEAKVYIDFGEHPGKDRLPREAAALGCCVITNRRGSAGNSVDVPIPEDCKIDDRKPGFERRAALKIHKLLDEFDQQTHRFDNYRNAIAAEPAQFANDVAGVFAEVTV